MAKLVHFTAKRGDRSSSEYIALIDDDEDIDEYTEPGYSAGAIFYLESQDVPSRAYTLPLSRLFREW